MNYIYDYYMILGIEKNASKEEIKKAYKNLLIKWHPDKNPNFNNEKFQKILEAYDFLSDIEKRKNYDNYRMNMINNAICKKENGRTGNKEKKRKKFIIKTLERKRNYNGKIVSEFKSILNNENKENNKIKIEIRKNYRANKYYWKDNFLKNNNQKRKFKEYFLYDDNIFDKDLNFEYI